ncbi:hypothetical protein QBC38DRAFT_178534 [Podospora fimiseda]|uniref:Transmembrane protein n=1 Tax=Podospora fimiseda TaxID=252190 RepID=A0AAN7BYW6_9PEZI|nr:hypothetical protein QBC38DRAFT_178534 [Podospora fimiseda]
MGSVDLDHVLFSRASWRKTVLVPAWLFQILVLLCLMGIFAYRLAETFEHYEDEIAAGQIPMVEIVWEATNVGFNLISLILTILEIARYLTERLTPFLLLGTQIVKITLSLAVLGLDVVAHLRSMDGFYATIGLSLDCGLLAVNFSVLIYSIICYRRTLKYEDYHINGPVSQGLHPQGNYPSDTKKSRYSVNVTSLELTSPRPYNPQHDYNYARTVESEHRRISGIHPAYRDTAPDTSYHSQTEMMTGPKSKVGANGGMPRQSHFQEQMSPIGGKPPSSNPDFKAEVDKALGTEFGWDNKGSEGNGGVDRHGSNSKIVGGGMVRDRQSVQSVEGVQRTQSWRTEVVNEVDMGVMGSKGVVDGRGDHEQLLR